MKLTARDRASGLESCAICIVVLLSTATHGEASDCLTRERGPFATWDRACRLHDASGQAVDARIGEEGSSERVVNAGASGIIGYSLQGGRDPSIGTWVEVGSRRWRVQLAVWYSRTLEVQNYYGTEVLPDGSRPCSVSTVCGSRWRITGRDVPIQGTLARYFWTDRRLSVHLLAGIAYSRPGRLECWTVEADPRGVPCEYSRAELIKLERGWAGCGRTGRCGDGHRGGDSGLCPRSGARVPFRGTARLSRRDDAGGGSWGPVLIRSGTAGGRHHALGWPLRVRALHPPRQSPLETVGQLHLSKATKLSRQFRAGCRLHARHSQRRASAMRQVRHLEFNDRVVVSDHTHLLHPSSRRLRSSQRHRGIRQRQSARPAPSDFRPSSVPIQQGTAETYRPNKKIVAGADLVVHRIDVRSAQIDLDRCLFPQPNSVTAHHHHIEIIRRGDIGPYRRTDGDYRDDVLVDLGSFKKGGHPVARVERRPPAH